MLFEYLLPSPSRTGSSSQSSACVSGSVAQSCGRAQQKGRSLEGGPGSSGKEDIPRKIPRFKYPHRYVPGRSAQHGGPAKTCQRQPNVRGLYRRGEKPLHWRNRWNITEYFCIKPKHVGTACVGFHQQQEAGFVLQLHREQIHQQMCEQQSVWLPALPQWWRVLVKRWVRVPMYLFRWIRRLVFENNFQMFSGCSCLSERTFIYPSSDTAQFISD